MTKNMQKVRKYLTELDIAIVEENAGEEIFIVEDEENGIKNLILDCEDPILIIEQLIMPVPEQNQTDLFRSLLRMNATIVHGAFHLDGEGKYVFFRDTLQLENLDKNELEGSIRSLALALAEHGNELIRFSKQA